MPKRLRRYREKIELPCGLLLPSRRNSAPPPLVVEVKQDLLAYCVDATILLDNKHLINR